MLFQNILMPIFPDFRKYVQSKDAIVCFPMQRLRRRIRYFIVLSTRHRPIDVPRRGVIRSTKSRRLSLSMRSAISLSRELAGVLLHYSNSQYSNNEKQQRTTRHAYFLNSNWWHTLEFQATACFLHFRHGTHGTRNEMTVVWMGWNEQERVFVGWSTWICSCVKERICACLIAKMGLVTMFQPPLFLCC
jgi:hypothetical protein